MFDADAVVLYGEDEDDAVVWGAGEFDWESICDQCGCSPCHARCGHFPAPSDDGDGYAESGWSEYLHGQWE